MTMMAQLQVRLLWSVRSFVAITAVDRRASSAAGPAATIAENAAGRRVYLMDGVWRQRIQNPPTPFMKGGRRVYLMDGVWRQRVQNPPTPFTKGGRAENAAGRRVYLMDGVWQQRIQNPPTPFTKGGRAENHTKTKHQTSSSCLRAFVALSPLWYCLCQLGKGGWLGSVCYGVFAASLLQ